MQWQTIKQSCIAAVSAQAAAYIVVLAMIAESLTRGHTNMQKHSLQMDKVKAPTVREYHRG